MCGQVMSEMGPKLWGGSHPIWTVPALMETSFFIILRHLMAHLEQVVGDGFVLYMRCGRGHVYEEV
jgi:hypothetical protein